MRILQTIVLSQFVRGFLAKIVAGYIKLVYRTSCWRYINREVFAQLVAQKKPIICAFWHGRLLMMPGAWQWKWPFYMLLSRHREGLMIAQILRCFGILSIHGSTNRGGIKAGLEIVDKLREGAAVGFAPDGPRGPSQKCSAGVISLAHLASKDIGEVYIVPSSFSISNNKTLRSWDRFMIAFPFARRGCFVLEQPVIIHQFMTKEELSTAQIQLEKRLNQAQDQADQYVRGETNDTNRKNHHTF